jgi:hypothetical protein
VTSISSWRQVLDPLGKILDPKCHGSFNMTAGRDDISTTMRTAVDITVKSIFGQKTKNKKLFKKLLKKL